MKRAIFIILPLLAIIVSVFVILFTPFGSNAILKPIVNTYLQQKIKKPKIKITKLDSKYKWISIDAISDNGIKAHTEGDVDYFKKKFGLDYKIAAKSVTVNDRDIKVDLDVKGQAVGSIKNIGINGNGEAFGSDVNYKFILKDKIPSSIEANIASAEIAKIFALLKQPAFIDGLISIDARLPNLDIKNPKGNANIKITQGRFNRALLYKNYKIKIPKDEKFVANAKAVVKGKYLLSKGEFNSTSLKLNIKKLTSTLDFNIAKGFFSLYIPNLSRLNELLNQNLRGKLLANGVFYINNKKNILQTNLQSKSFGGLIKLFYNNKKIILNLKNVSIVKVLKTLSQPFYLSSGVINGVIDIKDTKNLNGIFNISSNGTLNKKLLKVRLPSYRYKIATKGYLKDGILKLKVANVLTNFVKLNLQNLQYIIPKNHLKTSFFVNIDNLEALQMFTKKVFKGKLKAKGRVEYKNSKLNLQAFTKSLGGNVKIDYNTNSLNANFSDISLPKAIYMLNYPKYISNGVASGQLKLTDIDKLNGSISVKSVGSLNTPLIKRLHDINLGEKFRYSLLINKSKIKNGIILSKPIVDTSFAKIKFEYLNYNINNQTLNAKYQLNINNLNRLKPLVGMPLNGSFNINGNIKQSNNMLSINGVANELGGVINFIYDQPKLKLNAAGVSVIRLFRMLNLEESLDGVAKLDLDYNSDSKLGKFTIRLDEARFLNSRLVEMLKHYANFDLSQEIFTQANIDGVIDNNIITFNLKTNSQRVKIESYNAKLDINNQTIDARVKITQKNQDYNFRISGPIDNPHIKFILAGYVQKKIKKRVLKELEKRGLDKKIKKIIPKELQLIEDNQTKDEIKKIIPKKVIPKEIKGIFDKLL